MIRSMLLVLVIAGLVGCAGGSGQGPIIPTSNVCQVERCKDSVICQEFGQPDVVFGATEIGLVALVIAEPDTKAIILKGYKALFMVVSMEEFTYGQIAGIIAGQFNVGKWSPLISLATTKLGRLTGTVPVVQCDREFLMDHCITVISALGGTP